MIIEVKDYFLLRWTVFSVSVLWLDSQKIARDDYGRGKMFIFCLIFYGQFDAK